MMPDLSILSDIISIANRWEQSGEPPGSLMRDILPRAAEVLPEMRALRVYRVGGETLFLVGASDRDTTGTPPIDDHFLHVVLSRKESLLFDAASARWGALLCWDKRPFYLLEVVSDPEHEETPGAELWLAVLVSHLTTILKLHAMHWRLQRLTLTVNELVAGQAFEDMAPIIARHMLPQAGRLMHLGRLVYDDQSHIRGWNLFVTVNRHGTYTMDDPFLPWEDVGTVIQSTVFDGEPFVMNDIDKVTPDEIGTNFYERLHKQNTNAYLNIPIILSDQTNISLAILSRDKNAFPPEEVDTFRTVAALMGALIDVSTLRDQTEVTGDVVDNLVLANRLIATAASTAYMAQAVVYTLARDFAAVAVTQFDHPLGLGEYPTRHQLVAFSSEMDVVELDDPPDVYLLSAEETQRLHAGLPFVLTGDTLREYMPAVMTDHFEGHEMRWAALFGMRSGNELLGTLVLLSTHDRELSDAEANAYTTLADQVGLVLHSRQLLSVAREANEITAQLVRTNRAISAATDDDEICRVILQSLPSPVLAVALLLFDIPVVSGAFPDSVTMRVVVTQEGEEHLDVIDRLHPEHPRYRDVLDALVAGQPLLIPNTREISPLMPLSAAHFAEKGIYNVILVGLPVGDRVIGCLLLGLQDDTQISEIQMGNLFSIAGQTAVTLENHRLFTQTTEALGFVHAQFETTSSVYHAETPLQMLNALHRFAMFSGAYFDSGRLAMIDSVGGESASPVLRVVAEIRGERGIETSRVVSPSDLPGVGTLADLETVMLPNIMHGGALSSSAVKTLHGSGVEALFVLPMFSGGGQLLGLVHFIAAEPVEILPDRMRILSTLVEQAAVVLENRDLLSRTESGLREAQTLYNTNRGLLSARDSKEVLKVLWQQLVPDALFVNLFAMTWDEMTEDIGTVSQEAALSSLGDTLPQDGISEAVYRGGQVLFVENVSAALEDEPCLRWFAPHGAQSMVIIPVIEDDQLLNQINIAFDAPRTFDAQTHRLFDAIRDQVKVVLQNQRLLLDTRTIAANLGNQVRVLRTINQLASALSGTQDEQMLMGTACEALYNALRVDHVSLALMDSDGTSSTIVSEFPRRGALAMRISERNPIHTRLQEQNSPVILYVETDADLSSLDRSALSRLGVKTLLLVPLLDGRSGYLGAIILGVFSSEYTFTTDNIDIARTITSQIAVSLQNLRLLQSTQHQATQMEQIATFSRAIQTTLDVAELLEIGLRNMDSVIAADHMAIILYDTSKDRLRTVAWKEPSGAVHVNLAGGPSVSLENTTAGQVWRTREPLYIPDLHKADVVYTFGDMVRTVATLPIFTRGVMNGLIEVAHPSVDAYTATDHAVFRQVVNQLAVAIENAESYAQSQRQAQSRAMINDISSSLQRQIEIDRILGVTMQELGKALGARRARIHLSAAALTDETDEES